MGVDRLTENLENVFTTPIAGGNIAHASAQGIATAIMQEIGDPAESTVASVNGKTGAVTLGKADIGLGNADNTTDADKPVSTAQQAALDGKAAASHTHEIAGVSGLQGALDGKAASGHSHGAATQSAAGFMSTADKTKLDGMATGATNTPLSSTAPADLGAAASVGAGSSAARADHVHKLPTFSDVGAMRQARDVVVSTAETSISTSEFITWLTNNGYITSTPKSEVLRISNGINPVINDTGETGHPSIVLEGATVRITGAIDGFSIEVHTRSTWALADRHEDWVYVQNDTDPYPCWRRLLNAKTAGAGGLILLSLYALSSLPPAMNGTAAPGSSNIPSRQDHVHPVDTSRAAASHDHADATTSADGFMTADDKTKLNGIATGATNTPLATTTPAALGTAAVGTGSSAARADHVHALPTPAAIGALAAGAQAADSAKIAGTTPGAGGLLLAALSALSTAAPAMNGTAAPGSSNIPSRQDHVHPVDTSRAAASHDHADATTTADGFMTAADKTKLNGIANGATNTPLATTTPAALGTAAVGTATSVARADHVHAIPSLGQIGAAASSHDHADATTSADGFMTAADKSALNELALCTLPVGSVMFQLPSQSAPDVLFPGTTWTNISSTYAGAFFRAEGGKAGTFGPTKQPFAMQGHRHTSGAGSGFWNNFEGGGTYINGGGSNAAGASANTGSPTTDGTNGIVNFSNETRPDNYTIRVWKRTA